MLDFGRVRCGTLVVVVVVVVVVFVVGGLCLHEGQKRSISIPYLVTNIMKITHFSAFNLPSLMLFDVP